MGKKFRPVLGVDAGKDIAFLTELLRRASSGEGITQYLDVIWEHCLCKADNKAVRLLAYQILQLAGAGAADDSSKVIPGTRHASTHARGQVRQARATRARTSYCCQVIVNVLQDLSSDDSDIVTAALQHIAALPATVSTHCPRRRRALSRGLNARGQARLRRCELRRIHVSLLRPSKSSGASGT